MASVVISLIVRHSIVLNYIWKKGNVALEGIIGSVYQMAFREEYTTHPLEKKRQISFIS